MKLTFGTHEDIDRIETGNTVLIAGLYNQEFKFINNKIGKIKSMYFRKDAADLAYVADVELVDTQKIYTINMEYLYKMNIKNVVDNIVQHIITIDNPAVYYFKKKSLKESMNMRDELGQFMSICMDIKGKSHVLFFSGVN